MSTLPQPYATVQFDNALRGLDTGFEQALAYHALEAVISTPRHLDRIAAAVALCQRGVVQVRAHYALQREGALRWVGSVARVKTHPTALHAEIVSSSNCSCDQPFPCAHRYSVLLYVAATRTAEQAQYEACA